MMFPPPLHPSMLAKQNSCCDLSWLLLPLQPIPVIVNTNVPMAQIFHTNLQDVRTALPAVDWGTLAWGRLSRDLEIALQVLTMCSALYCAAGCCDICCPRQS